MDNLEDPANRIDTEASSNEPFSSSKKRKLSNDEYQNEFESINQKLNKQKEIIYSQTCELHEERHMLKNVKDELERMKKVETELQLKIDTFEVQKKMTDAKLRSDMNDQLARLKKQNDEKDKKIKELEAQLQSKETAETSLLAKMTEMQQNNNSKINLLQAENDRLNAIIKEQDQKSKEIERKLAAEVSNVAQLEFELEEMKKCYKTDLQKNEEDKKALKNEHEKKMADIKTEIQGKIDNERKEQADAINQLNATNEDLLKKISKNQEALIQYQSQIKELNDKITASKNFNIELHCQHEELKQKELNARAEIIDREKQIQVLQNELAESNDKSGDECGEESSKKSDVEDSDVEEDEPAERIVDLDELCDDSGFCYDHLLGQNNITVIKVEKFDYMFNKLHLHSDSSDRFIELNLLDFIQNTCRFQINGECNLNHANDSTYFNEIMPIVHSWNLKKLDIRYDIDYQNFKKLVSSRTITTFICRNSVKRKNGEYLRIDEILKKLPNIEICEIQEYDVSKKDCKKLVQLPTFTNLRKFTLKLTKSPIDVLYFAEFIKKNQNAEFTFDVRPLRITAQRNFPKKIQDLCEILPSNCKVTHQHRDYYFD